MPLSLSTILANTQHPSTPVLVLQAHLSHHLPILRTLIQASLRLKHRVILVTFTTPAAYFNNVSPNDISFSQYLSVIDCTDRVPGYGNTADELWHDPREEVVEVVKNAPSGLLSVFVEGVDTLCSDLGSVSKAFALLKAISALVKARPNSSRFVLSVSQSSELLPLLIPPNALNQNLTHFILHPPSLLAYLAQSFLTLPPPYSTEAKFWALFAGATHRGEGVDWRALSASEGLVEVRVRTRKVERHLEGWRVRPGGSRDVEPCEWQQLSGMHAVLEGFRRTEHISAGSQSQTSSTDPTDNLPFNLTLTPSQQQARASVPLPYAHSGVSKIYSSNGMLKFGLGEGGAQGEILYDPDSGDDIDDDDPDEDLDI